MDDLKSFSSKKYNTYLELLSKDVLCLIYTKVHRMNYYYVKKELLNKLLHVTKHFDNRKTYEVGLAPYHNGKLERSAFVHDCEIPIFEIWMNSSAEFNSKCGYSKQLDGDWRLFYYGRFF